MNKEERTMKCMKTLLEIAIVSTGLLLHAAELKIPFTSEEAADWSKTNSATFSFKDNLVSIDGTNWDSKIWRIIELKQEKKYKLVVTAKGMVSIRVTNGQWTKDSIYLSLNFNGRDFITKSTQFQLPKTPLKQQMLVIQVAAKSHAEVKGIKFLEMDSQAGDEK